MHHVQIFATVINISRLCLIAGVFFGSASADHSYVSTKMEMLTPFKICLSALVFTEILICMSYITVLSMPPVQNMHALLASVLACFALGGWTALASVSLNYLTHQMGTVAFLIGSAGLHALLVSNTKAENAELGAMWMFVVAYGLTFLATCYLPITRDTAATVEWIGFMLEATVFVLYYVKVPPGCMASQPCHDRGSGAEQDSDAALMLN
jgi:hypothetical protein